MPSPLLLYCIPLRQASLYVVPRSGSVRSSPVINYQLGGEVASLPGYTLILAPFVPLPFTYIAINYQISFK